MAIAVSETGATLHMGKRSCVDYHREEMAMGRGPHHIVEETSGEEALKLLDRAGQ